MRRSAIIAAFWLFVTGPAVRAEEVISRAWTIQNVLEPTFTESISRADTIQNVLEPVFTEAISQAVTECNIGIFADEDGDTVHDCFDICPGGNDLVDNDNNDIPDECEPGSCCFMVGDVPACFNSNKLECESPPFNGVYGGEGSSCTQNFAIINESSGVVFIHVVGPPAVCNTGDPPPTCNEPATAGVTPPPRLDAWKTYGTLNHSFAPAAGGTPIPAGFFGVGSDAVESSVALQGKPLNDPQFPGADTIVRRHGDPFELCSQGPFPVTADPVPIEIIALSLENPLAAPMIVTYNGGTNPEEWDVTVGLGGTAPMGMLTATKEHCNGGTYTSTLNVLPQFTFRRRSNGTLRGLIPPTHMVFEQDDPAPWVHDVDPAYDAAIDPCSTFHAGFEVNASPASCGVDPDGDGLRTQCDNCPDEANLDQLDTDNDTFGDACDNCPLVANPGQEDCDNNGQGDVCDTAFADCQPNGIPDGCETAPVAPLRQNSSDAMQTSVACWISGSQCSRQNGWSRCFPITEETVVDGVSFGVLTAAGPPWTLTVRLWQDNDGSCPPSSVSTATIVRQRTVQVSSAQQGQLVTVSIEPPLSLSPGEHVIAEVQAPDGCAQVGFGALFFIAMNQLGETAPSYLRTNFCTPLDWASHASFGFGTYSTVLYLRNRPPAADLNGNSTPDECEAPFAAAPDPEGDKTRSISFTVPPPSAATGGSSQAAVRVTMLDLQNPVPPNDLCCPPPDYSAYESATCMAGGEMNGCARWMGPPVTALEAQDLPGLGSYRAARLQCTPYYHDWNGEDVVHLLGAEIIPSSTYEVEVFASLCKGNEDTCAAVSAPVTLATRRAGDISSPYAPIAPGQPNAIDVANAVNHFKKLAGSPRKAEAQLQPNVPDPHLDLNALDIGAIVDNLKLRAYPFSGPCPCPSAVPCGVTSCANAAACTGPYGPGATCVRTCSGGPNAGQPCSNDMHCGRCAAGARVSYPCDADDDCPDSTCTLGACGAGFCRDACARCGP